MRQDVRAIDWSSDSTDTVVRKIRAAEGHPGVLDEVEGTMFHLFGVHRERALRGTAGEIIGRRDGAICRATIDGAVWVTHLKRRDTEQRTYFKLQHPGAPEPWLGGGQSVQRRRRDRRRPNDRVRPAGRGCPT
jgi:putative two-component system hydrogenase maturation factor HypX/HoxX